MGYIHTININDQNQYLIEPILYTTANSNGESSALIASITNFELVPGVAITMKMATSNANAASLIINNMEKPIYYKGAPVTGGLLKQNFIYNLVYDGTAWHVVGEKIDNSEITLAHKLTFGAGQSYVYDGSADVTVPVFTGTIL